MINTKLFYGDNLPIIIYNGQAIIDEVFHFFTVETCFPEGYVETDYDFPDYVSSYLKIFNLRSGKLLKEIGLTRDGSNLILNASVLEMTFEDEGVYYYEIGYVRAVYEQVLRYGEANVI